MVLDLAQLCAVSQRYTEMTPTLDALLTAYGISPMLRDLTSDMETDLPETFFAHYNAGMKFTTIGVYFDAYSNIRINTNISPSYQKAVVSVDRVLGERTVYEECIRVENGVFNSRPYKAYELNQERIYTLYRYNGTNPDPTIQFSERPELYEKLSVVLFNVPRYVQILQEGTGSEYGKELARALYHYSATADLLRPYYAFTINYAYPCKCVSSLLNYDSEPAKIYKRVYPISNGLVSDGMLQVSNVSGRYASLTYELSLDTIVTTSGDTISFYDATAQEYITITGIQGIGF